ncbi:MAG TPA: sigma-70 family RNA polymerase sigma factor [Caulobacteraceae bacterium]|jgi:RNA polymerase sigma-70 factor (ECF subfamily)
MVGNPSPRSPAGLHDVELASLSAAGDRKAFGELVRRHGSAVRALLRRMGADPATADDLAQDAFLAAFEAIADFRGEGAFAGWVKRIAARLYIKRWKKAKSLDLGLEPEDTPLPSHESESNTRVDLDEAMKVLSPAERMSVSLCFGGGLSHSEAAEALNTPLGTVKSHVKRGLDKLRRRLEAVPERPGRQVHG